MDLRSRFANSQARGVPTGRAPVRRKSKYAGVSAATARHPQPGLGQYKFRIVETTELSNPRTGETFRATLEVLEAQGPEASPVGSLVVFLQSTSGAAQAPGCARVKRFVMTTLGLDDEAAYDEFDPDGEFLDACAGTPCQKYTADPLVERSVYAEVLRGGEDGRGGFYREWQWFPDEEQADMAATP